MRLDKWLKVSRLIKRRTVFPQTAGRLWGPLAISIAAAGNEFRPPAPQRRRLASARIGHGAYL